jgi:hypothetical protein
MAILVNRFVGTDGTDLTTGNSAAGGDAFDLINAGANALEYSTAVTNPFTGGTVAKVEAGAGIAGEARWNPANSNQGAARLVYWATALPTTASNDDMTIRGTRQNAGMRYHTGGQRRTLNIGSEIGGTANYSGITGEWVVQDLVCVEGTTSSNGTIKSRIRRLSDLSTVVSSYTATNRDAGVIGTDVINSFRFGKTTTASVMPAFYMAEVAADPAATDWLPDPTTGATVSAVCATATALAEAPAVSAEVVVASSGPATATALASAPVVTGGATVTAVRATSSALATPPTLTTGAVVAAVRATAAAAAGTPVVAGGAVVAAVCATATASATPPTVAASSASTVNAVTATATATAGTPAVTTGAAVTAVRATATAAAPSPVVAGGATVTAVRATSTAAAGVPSVAGGATVTAVKAAAASVAYAPAATGGAVVSVAVATATAGAWAPTVEGRGLLDPPIPRFTTVGFTQRVTSIVD